MSLHANTHSRRHSEGSAIFHSQQGQQWHCAGGCQQLLLLSGSKLLPIPDLSQTSWERVTGKNGMRVFPYSGDSCLGYFCANDDRGPWGHLREAWGLWKMIKGKQMNIKKHKSGCLGLGDTVCWRSWKRVSGHSVVASFLSSVISSPWSELRILSAGFGPFSLLRKEPQGFREALWQGGSLVLELSETSSCSMEWKC